MIKKCKILFRGDTKKNWLNTNSILHKREIVIETDSNRLKIGDGVKKYSELPYFFGDWQTWGNETKQHFGLPNKPIITYHPAKQETQLGENSPKLEIGRNSTRLNLGNQVSTIQIGKYTGYLEVGKKAQNILLGDQNKNTTVGRDSEKASFGEGTGVVLIGGKSPSQKLQIGDDSVGYLRTFRDNSTNIMLLTPRGGELHIGKYNKNDLPLNKITIGRKIAGDVLRADDILNNTYFLVSNPIPNPNNRVMNVSVGQYIRHIQIGSFSEYVHIGHQADKVYLRGKNTYIDSIPNGSYGDIGGMLAVNNAGKVYKINEANFKSWVGVSDVLSMASNNEVRLNALYTKVEELEEMVNYLEAYIR